MAMMVETVTRMEELLAQSLGCMRVARTLGNALSATRSNGESAH
jgi:hypothetical protein